MKTALGELPGDDPSNRLEVSCDTTSDVVPETRVLVSRRLEDKNESLGLGLGLGHEHLVLVLVSVLKKKVLQFFKTFAIILDGIEQGTLWHFVRDNKSSLPFGSHWLIEPSALHAHQPQLRGYLTTGLFVRRHRR